MCDYFIQQCSRESVKIKSQHEIRDEDLPHDQTGVSNLPLVMYVLVCMYVLCMYACIIPYHNFEYVFSFLGWRQYNINDYEYQLSFQKRLNCSTSFPLGSCMPLSKFLNGPRSQFSCLSDGKNAAAFLLSNCKD